MKHQYDWSKLGAGWTHHDSQQGPYLEAEYYGVLKQFYYRESYGMTPFGLLAVEQLRKCRTNAQLVNDFLRQRDQAHDRQRKHEATHGWRNPPCIYEEQI